MREDRATALFHLTAGAERRADAGRRGLRRAAAGRQATSARRRRSSSTTATARSSCPTFAGSFAINDKERGVADWAWRNRKKAGRFTDTLPSAEGFHLPLVREDTAIGVLVIQDAARGHALPRAAGPRRELRRPAGAARRARAAARRRRAREAARRVRQAPPHAPRRRLPRAEDAACRPQLRRREPRVGRRGDPRDLATRSGPPPAG
jgi:K+-sensing histidine kinase KdpD